MFLTQFSFSYLVPNLFYYSAFSDEEVAKISGSYDGQPAINEVKGGRLGERSFKIEVKKCFSIHFISLVVLKQTFIESSENHFRFFKCTRAFH